MDQDWERVEAQMARHDVTEASTRAAQSVAATQTAPVISAVKPGELAARTIKVTVVLEPQEVLAIPVPDGAPHVQVVIHATTRTLRAQLTAKGLRKAQAAIREVGPDGVAVILQGKLAASDALEEAGLSAQPRGPKPANGNLEGR
jgi:hypothetical protein